MLLWYKIWQLSEYNHTRATQKLLKRPRRACKSSCIRRGNQKSFTLTIAQNLASPAKNYPGITVRQHLTDRKRMGLRREQCAELGKGLLRCCCNQVWLKNGGRIPWNATAIMEIFGVFCLMGRHCRKGGSEYHPTARPFHLRQWSNITLFLAKTFREDINVVLQSCQIYSSVFLVRDENLEKGDIMVADTGVFGGDVRI